MRRGERLIVKAGRQIRHRPVGTHGHHALVAHALGLVIAQGIEVVAILCFAVLALAFGLLAARLGGGIAVARLLLAVVAFVLILIGGILLFLAAFVGWLLRIVRLDQREMLQQAGGELLEGALIVQSERQRIEIGPGLLLDPFTYEIDTHARGLGRGIAGEPLSHHQRDSGGERHLVRAPGAGDGVGLQLEVERVREIIPHTRHAAGAQCLHACLLGGVIDRACDGFGGRGAIVQGCVVMAQLERAGICKTARQRHLIAGQGAAGAGHLDRLAGEVRRVGGETDLGLRVARDRACGAGENRLEGIERGLGSHKSGLREEMRQVKSRFVSRHSGT